KAVRDEHWKAFSDDPEWKTLSAQPQYQHNVSRNETIFLAPTDYSDF
ncbi:MAG: NIPSNAP family containing protein, partial [Flavisolibacter sp.]|nr:NIPSNAP family containing protein [Flavisolibacter sp.]